MQDCIRCSSNISENGKKRAVTHRSCGSFCLAGNSVFIAAESIFRKAAEQVFSGIMLTENEIPG